MGKIISLPSLEEVEKRLRKRDTNLMSPLGLPKLTQKHSPEHQRHICRFKKIPIWEYDHWLACRNYYEWRKANHDAMVLAEKRKKP